MRVLFLTNNENTKRLYIWLSERCEIQYYGDKLTIDFVKETSPDLIVSYNYKYLIKEDVIKYMSGNVINLHISYLPWNRGSNPNYWSFVENTPKGVTIHQVSKELDEGQIMYQKQIVFDTNIETFSSSYQKLHDEILQLFIENWENIKNKEYILRKQNGKGSYHNQEDFIKLTTLYPLSWDENIESYLMKLHSE